MGRVRARLHRIVLTVILIVGVGPLARADDGVVEINQVRALAGGVTPGDSPGFPVTLSESGGYVLTGNLTVSDPNAPAIAATSAGVAIDLNGFSVVGPVDCSGSGPTLTCDITGAGVGIAAPQGATVRDGSVSGFASGGISLGSNARVLRVSVVRNGGSGIVVGDGSLVSESSGSLNFASGIEASAASVVVDSRARHNHGYGIGAGDYTNVRGSVARGNVGFGLATGGSSLTGFSQSVFGDNNGGDAFPQTEGGVDLGQNLCGPRTLCP